jgi:hypothetical protein
VLVPRYKLSLCHTPIKPDLLGFPGIGVFACGLHNHVIMRFASVALGKTSLTRLVLGQTHQPLFHMNWALLGPELDELKVVLHAP